MSETRILIDEEETTYEGLFNLADIYSLIDEYTKQKGYDKEEVENTEQVSEKGKQCHLIIKPNKLVSDYFQIIMKIELTTSGMKDVEAEIDKKKRKLNKGKLNIKWSAIIISDWEGRWKDKPIYYFIRTLYDKYFYRSQTDSFDRHLEDDLHHLKEQVESLLNLETRKKR